MEEKERAGEKKEEGKGNNKTFEKLGCVLFRGGAGKGRGEG